MDITQTSSEGLAREFKVIVAATELDERLMARLEEIKGQIQIKGFRPGKVPVAHLKRVHGKSVMTEVVQEIVTRSAEDTLTQHEIKSAQQPRINLPEAEELERLG